LGCEGTGHDSNLEVRLDEEELLDGVGVAGGCHAMGGRAVLGHGEIGTFTPGGVHGVSFGELVELLRKGSLDGTVTHGRVCRLLDNHGLVCLGFLVLDAKVDFLKL
jgi:hypothetical protein